MTATVRIQTDRLIAKASPHLRGHFVELVHRCIDGGIFEQGSPLSDERGFRSDVLELLKSLRPGMIRFPGGNFSCDYNWKQGVLPIEQRPRRYNYGTRQIESYRFGTHEFLEYCRAVGAEPLLTINAGNGTPELAAEWVEYCNSDGDGEFARLRRANGFDKPFNVKHWCIGNEIYGDWVPGTKTGEEYGKFAGETARVMKWVDPTIKLVGMATGSYMPDWDRASIDATVDLVDYISLHIYVGRRNYYDCVGSPQVIQRGIDLVRGEIESAATRKNLAKLPLIALDEYNVWYRTVHFPDFLEERFNLQDALTLAGIQHVIFRNASVVGIACLSMITNVLGPIMTSPEGAFRQAIYWPLKFVADYFAEDVVDCFVSGPTFSCRHPKHFAGIVPVDAEGRDIENEMQKTLTVELSDLPYLDLCCTVDRAKRRLCISAINRHETESIEGDLQILGDKITGQATGQFLTANSVKTENSFQSPDAVAPSATNPFPASNAFPHTFPPHSHTLLALPLS